MYGYAKANWLGDTVVYSLHDFPDNIASFALVQVDTTRDTALDSTVAVSFTKTHALYGHLNKFYFKMTFEGLADTAEVDTAGSALLRALERRL
jgi:hypothetical protein